MSYAVGIDLGTTNSVISVFRRGVIETLLVEGRTTTPSVVSFRDTGEVLVGQAAKARLLLDPEQTIASAKRHMGDQSKRYPIGAASVSPIEVSCLILKKLIQGAREALGSEIRDAVITVPAYFTEAQRADTKRAVEAAGLKVLRLLPEPTAAAIAYGFDKGKDQTLMVYDLGGGTFDVSILEIQGDDFKVKAVGGNSQLGGDDFDQAIMQWSADQFKQQTGVDLLNNTTRAGRIAQQRLKEVAEAAKIELSQSQKTILALPDCLGYPLELELTLAQYNTLIAPLVQQTVDCMRMVLADAKLQPEEIDRVILVGGSTQNRLVREKVAEAIKDPYSAERVDEVVAHGAGILAANLTGLMPAELQVSDVTAHSLGIDMIVDDKLTFVPIIPRQTCYPCRQGVIGVTRYPKQDSVKMCVYRGESAEPEENNYRGELILPVEPPHKESVPVGAVFALDADGIIHFTAVQLPIGSHSQPILQYADDHDGALDLASVDRLIQQNLAKTKTVQIQSGEDRS
jgi:molecular chaperone DnaK